MMKWFTRCAMPIIAISAILLAVGCASAPKVEFKQAISLPTVFAKGYAWGENAKEKAEKAALLEATALSMPRSIEFTYLRVGPYSMFMTEKAEYADAKIIANKQLPDGGYEATAQANRSKESLRWMQFKTTANYQLICKGETFRQRAEQCNQLIYEHSMKIFAEKMFGGMPEKMKGNFTFYNISRDDNGKKMTAKVAVFVGFLGRGELTAEEKGMVLMNAWRSSVAAGAGARGKAIYQQAIKAFPNAEYAKEFGLYEMAEGRLSNAVMAMKDAIRIAPHEVEYLKILYQVYKKKGDTVAMQNMQKKLEQLEAWEDNPGADITSGFQWKTKISWSEGGDEKEPTGIIRFREMDEDEAESMKATEKEE